jgi:hypothetical protein
MFASVELEQLSELTGLPTGCLQALEDGTVLNAEPGSVLSDLVRVARCLGISSRSLVNATLAEWSRAYAYAETREKTHNGVAGFDTAMAVVLPIAAPRDPPTLEMPAIKVDRPSLGGQRGAARGSLLNFRWARGSGAERHLFRAAIAVGSATVLAAGVLLSTHLGLFGPSHQTPLGAHASARAPVTHRDPSTAAAVHLVGSDSTSASYQIAEPRFTLKISADRPTWIEVGAPNGPATFAQVVQPGQSPTFQESTPVDVVIGAGGTSVTITSNQATAVLKPPDAPYTYLFM